MGKTLEEKLSYMLDGDSVLLYDEDSGLAGSVGASSDGTYTVVYSRNRLKLEFYRCNTVKEVLDFVERGAVE